MFKETVWPCVVCRAAILPVIGARAGRKPAVNARRRAPESYTEKGRLPVSDANRTFPGISRGDFAGRSFLCVCLPSPPAQLPARRPRTAVFACSVRSVPLFTKFSFLLVFVGARSLGFASRS